MRFAWTDDFVASMYALEESPRDLRHPRGRAGLHLLATVEPTGTVEDFFDHFQTAPQMSERRPHDGGATRRGRVRR